MPENNTDPTPEAADTAAVPAEMPAAATEADIGTNTADSAEADDSPDDSDSHPGRREARYRTQLRQAEAERDALLTQVQNLQRAQVDSVIASHGVKPAAVWAAGTELASLLTADGLPNPAAVKAAVAATRTEFGIAGKARPNASGLKSGAGLPQASPPKWAAAFGPRDK